MVSDSVSEKFGIKKSIGFGIVKIWYREKYRIQYWKNLVSEKKFRIRFRSDFGYRHTLFLLPYSSVPNKSGKHTITWLKHDPQGNTTIFSQPKLSATLRSPFCLLS